MSVHVDSLNKLSHWHSHTVPHLGSPVWGDQHSQLWRLRSRGSVGGYGESRAERLAELQRGQHAPMHCGKWAMNAACSGNPLFQGSKGCRGGFGASSVGPAAAPWAPTGPRLKGLFTSCHGQFSCHFTGHPKSGRGSERSLAQCPSRGKGALRIEAGAVVSGAGGEPVGLVCLLGEDRGATVTRDEKACPQALHKPRSHSSPGPSWLIRPWVSFR